MGISKYCVYDKTQETFVSLGVVAVESMADGQGVIVDETVFHADTGLWFVPYRENNDHRQFPPFDVVCLDENRRVIQVLEAHRMERSLPAKLYPASLLFLPHRTIYHAQIYPGDELLICGAELMVSLLEDLSRSSSPAYTALSSDHGPDPMKTYGKMLATPISDRAVNRQGSSPVLAGCRTTEIDSASQNSEETWSLQWDYPQKEQKDRRRHERYTSCSVTAYYWTGKMLQAYKVANLSRTGFYLVTEERSLPGSLIPITLQITNAPDDATDTTIFVHATVTRWGLDGMGLEFVLSNPKELNTSQTFSKYGADHLALERFLQQLEVLGGSARSEFHKY